MLVFRKRLFCRERVLRIRDPLRPAADINAGGLDPHIFHREVVAAGSDTGPAVIDDGLSGGRVEHGFEPVLQFTLPEEIPIRAIFAADG